MRLIIVLVTLHAGAATVLSGPHGVAHLAGQQFIVDDAGTVGSGACQVEGWLGARNSWLLPACQFPLGPEVTLVIGASRDDSKGREAAWVLQAKLPVRDPDQHSWGWGVVAGLGGDPLAQVTGRRLRSAFVYLPLSVPTPLALIHFNLGWYSELGDKNAAESRDHHLAWGIRGDRALNSRLVNIGEVAGEGAEWPEWQVGIRLILFPDLLLADLSVGASLEPDRSGSGLALGAAWTPPPLR